MNTLSDSDLERLDRYLLGELSPQEMEEVAALISENAQWQDAYQLLLNTQHAGRNIFHREMRSHFSATDAHPGKSRMIRMIAIAAASIALMISALLWLLPSSEAGTLIAEYRSFPNIVLPIEKSGGDFSDREKAFQAYELGAYETAMQRFSALPDLQASDSTYLALSYLELRDYKHAQTLLRSLQQSNDIRWAQVAQWYEMWLYVRTDRADEAHAILQKVSATPGHRYETRASELLEKFE